MSKYTEGEAPIQLKIKAIMNKAGKPLKGWHIQAVLLREYGKRYSESSVTARLREMPKVTCNLTDYTYSIKD